MEEGNRFNSNKYEGIYSKTVRAGKKRTYFIDVRSTRANDFYLTITESKRKFEEGGYERHKLHLYKEDFTKFLEALEETVNYVKSELMPEYDFDEFNHKYDQDEYSSQFAKPKPVDDAAHSQEDEEELDGDDDDEEDEDDRW